MEFVDQAIMGNFWKALEKSITITSHCFPVAKFWVVLGDKFQKLGFTWSIFPESMLFVAEDIVVFKGIHEWGGDNMFHKFTAYARNGYCSIAALSLSPLLKIGAMRANFQSLRILWACREWVNMALIIGAIIRDISLRVLGVKASGPAASCTLLPLGSILSQCAGRGEDLLPWCRIIFWAVKIWKMHQTKVFLLTIFSSSVRYKIIWKCDCYTAV